MKFILLFLSIIYSMYSHGQERRNRFLVWTHHQHNVNIHGISVGIATFDKNPGNTNTNGIRLELIGSGIFVPLIGSSPIAENDSTFQKMQEDRVLETTNGLDISAFGSACNCVTNGISLGLIGQVKHRVNGISAVGFMNFAQIHHGIQVGVFNESYKMEGLQIGLFNKSKNMRGIQIGLWNVNEKRKFPLIN